MTRPNTHVGSPVERVEDARFLTGDGRYVDDLDYPGQWHAAFLRSPVAHGRVTALDCSKALAAAGVRAVLTVSDMADPIPTIPFRRPNPTIAPYAQPIIAGERLRYVGEPVAMVLADSAELAEDALAEIRLDIEPLPPLLDRAACLAGDRLLFDATETNLASLFQAAKGDAAAAFAAAPYVRRERFKLQRHTALPMEPRGLLATWDAGVLSVHGAAKLPFFNRRALAGMIGLPETAVHYVEWDVGGGFGARGEFYPEDFLVAFAAHRFGRPVKWVEDRREHFTAIAHAREAEGEIEIALARDGTILGLRGNLYVDIGAYVRPNGMTPVRNVAQFFSGPYRVSNIGIASHAILSNKTPVGTYRGPGRFESNFMMERLLDMAAADLGLDRLEIRRRNLLVPEEMPYKLASVEPNDGFGESACDSGDHRQTFDLCLQESRWHERSASAGKLIEGRYRGLGIACFIEGGASGPRENARMVLEPDGDVTVYVGSSSVGQGIETILGQIAADALEIPLARIRIRHGSTSYLGEGWGSYASRSTVMGGSAILDAAKGLLAKFRSAAAARLATDPDSLTLGEGAARAPDGRSIALAELAQENLASDGTFANSKATYAYGTAVAYVAVDPATGHVELLDYTIVDDVGRVINPLTLHGQVVGATVQGLGSTFSEHLVYDKDGQLLVGSLADYIMPLATDYPHIHAVTTELHPSPNNPLGAKGAGEGGVIPVGGALSNAVANALQSFGVQPRELPLTPPAVWALIEAAKARRRDGG
jgi:aerobic carbon-monoxide dehydrogenase large subunit